MRVTGSAPAALVWRRYADLDEWTGWAPNICALHASPRLLAAGLTGEVAGPLGVRAPFQILHVDADRRQWSWRVRFAGLEFTLHHGVEELPAGSATTLTVRGFAPAVLASWPLARWALRRLVRSS